MKKREASYRSPPFCRHQRLLVFTRYPAPGSTKTRLMPTLGAQGAADLQRQLTNQTLETARRFQSRHRCNQTEVHFTGGNPAAMRAMFGDDIVYRYQTEGTLGDRLYQGFQHAFGGTDAADCTIAVGTDCPSLDAYTIRKAFAVLVKRDMVIGPSVDGGYYLIGLNRAIPELFHYIDWGTERVLEQTRDRAKDLGLQIGWLDERRDIDEPEDLHAWAPIKSQQESGESKGPRLSIIIPALNEAKMLPRTLASVGNSSDIETIVVDASSHDGTPDTARSYGARVITASPGRANQMNTGATAATADLLLFLHADTRLPFGYLQQIDATLAEPDVVAGTFRLSFDNVTPSLSVIETCANYRSTYWGVPYGDQAIFLRYHTFHEMGGFREFPVMEDYEFNRRLRKRGRVGIVPLPVTTSARRWLTHGVWRTTLTHRCMILGWHLGLPAEYLARWRARKTASECSR